MMIGKRFSINVMMFGGRRSGKTSILAAMKECVDNVFNDERKLGLSISSADFDTMTALENKSQELREYYDAKKKFKPFTPDDNPTMVRQEYQFDIQLVDKPNAKLRMNFTDYPGEWLDDAQKFEELKDIMETSDIIMIAIDSPYLMENPSGGEEVGLYNERKNYSSRIADMVKEHFLVESGSERKKMILFVPLKCEKYYKHIESKEEIERLNTYVKRAYGKLLDFVTQGENRGRYECAITPIFTLGNVSFTRFDEDEQGNYIINPGKKYPSVPLYRFDPGAEKPDPKYCEQPLLYALVFLLKWSEQSRSRNQGMIGALLFKVDNLASKFLKFPNADDFAERSEYLRSKLKKEGDGFEIINDPLKFRGV